MQDSFRMEKYECLGVDKDMGMEDKDIQGLAEVVLVARLAKVLLAVLEDLRLRSWHKDQDRVQTVHQQKVYVLVVLEDLHS